MSDELGCTPVAATMGTSDGVQVIFAGLMRTGLRSMAAAMRQLGYLEIYDRVDLYKTYAMWDSAINNQATPEMWRSMFNGYKVVMGMPSFVFWEQIFEAFPNALVILTVRDEADWFKSVSEAKHQLDHEALAAPLRSGTFLQLLERYMMPSYHKICNVMRFSWASTLGISFLGSADLNEFVTRNMFRKHNLYVQHRVPKDQLLIMDVRDGWGKLCAFLNKPRPAAPFPSEHEVSYFLVEEVHRAISKSGEMSERNSVKDSGISSANKAIIKELRWSFGVVFAFVLLFLFFVVAELRLGTGGNAYFVLLLFVGVHLIISIWLAVKYVVQRMPLTQALPSALGMIFVAVAMNLVFLIYVILKEELVTRDHFPSIYIVIASRAMSVILALVGVLFIQGARVEVEGVQNDVSWVVRLLGAPLSTFALFSLANDTSTWAGYEMLKYVSFAVQVMAKSASILPTMITAYFVNRQVYSLKEYLQAFLLVAAVAVMQLEDKKGRGSSAHQSYDAGGWLGALGSPELRIGGLLLVVFFAFDSFTSQYQTKIYKKYKNISHWQMMLGGNIFAVLTTVSAAVVNHLYGVFWESPESQKPVGDVNLTILLKLGLLALTNAAGQILIYYTIKSYGAVIFQWIMTSRKVLSVVCSLIWFGHPVTPRKVMCIIFVFGLLIYQKVSSKKPKADDAKKGDSEPPKSGKRWMRELEITSETSQSDTERTPKNSSWTSWSVKQKQKPS
jgi:adenosine 3'-phospho 5'-phosphosulfate transporter B2